MHPFPAEHDQQQAEALDRLKGAKAFVLIYFEENEEECDHPLCGLLHRHRTTSVLASCSHRDLQLGMEALAEEIMVATSIETLMRLSPGERKQVAAMLRTGDKSFMRLEDDDDDD